jgi:putative ABC transport system permease protein
MRGWSLAFAYARREMRGGLAGFRIFLACLALGVAAIAGVGSLTAAITAGIVRDGRTLLGGDVEFRLTHREVGAAERAWLEGQGRVSANGQMRAMAGTPDRRALVELKAVDNLYPLYGTMDLQGGGSLADALAVRDGRPGAVVDDTLPLRLDVKVGDVLTVGDGDFVVRGIIAREPDHASGGFSLGPRVMISTDALAHTRLLLPGSLVNWEYRLQLPPGADARAVIAAANKAFPDAGWRGRDWRNGNPGLQQFIERLGLFLVLIGLTALLVGGVGVGNAVKAYLDGKTGTIATLKCVGAESGFIVRVYLAQVLLLAAIGIAIGLVLGAVIPSLLSQWAGHLLPVPVRLGLYPAPLALAALYGLLIALAFALWPLAKARETAPAGLFRDLVAPDRRLPSPFYIAATVAAFAALAAVAILTTEERRFAIWFVLGAGGSFITLRLAAEAIMRITARMGRPRQAALRLALANLHRPGAPTTSVVLSLGLGLTLLVTVALIEGNLRRAVEERLPNQAPSFFFVDIQNEQVAGFEAAIRAVPGAGEIQRVSSLRGRIVKVNGVPADQIQAAADQRWVLRGDRGITYAETPPANSRVVEGEWWPRDYAGPPLISFDEAAARGIGVKIGDTLTVNILGRELEGRIANLRRIEWGSFGLNFTLVFSPEPLRHAPHTHVATVKAEPMAEEPIFRAITRQFPNVSAIRVRDALETANGILTNVNNAVRAAAAVTLFAGVLVLAGALIAGRRQRMRDVVILKVLGAARPDVLRMQIVEYALLGLVTAVVAAIIGYVAAWVVVTELMRLPWQHLPLTAVGTALTGVLITVAFGLGATWRSLGVRAAQQLRHA